MFELRGLCRERDLSGHTRPTTTESPFPRAAGSYEHLQAMECEEWGVAGEKPESILVFVHVQDDEATSKETAGICWLEDFSLDRHDPSGE